jgi:hypothetical protein
MTMNNEIGISQILPTIQVPALVIHRTEDTLIDFEAGQFLAEQIPNCQFLQLPGRDHLPWTGDNMDQITDTIDDFITVENLSHLPDTVLTTILYIKVGYDGDDTGPSPEEWLSAAAVSIKHRLQRFRGRKIAPRDGFVLATFDGPARAMHCGLDIIAALSANKISTAIGVHTGEVKLHDENAYGPPPRTWPLNLPVRRRKIRCSTPAQSNNWRLGPDWTLSLARCQMANSLLMI